MAGLSRRQLFAASLSAAIAAGVGVDRVLSATAHAARATRGATLAPEPRGLTTLDQTVLFGATARGRYRRLASGPGEPHLCRLDVLQRNPRAGRLSARRSLGYIGHLSDLHVIDAQSPGRIEPLIDLDHAAWSSAFHPHDPLSVHTTAAMIQAFGDVRWSPVTGAPMTAAVVTGDSADMHSAMELRWYIDLLDGEPVDPATSGVEYEGVQAWPEATWAYRPSDPTGGPFGDYGFPRLPDLLKQAISAPVRSPGLPAPWYAVHGNHDKLLLGTFGVTPAFEALAVGARKAVTAASTAGVGLGGYASRTGVLQQAASAWGTALFDPAMRAVQSNSRREIYGALDFVAAHFRTTQQPGPIGHGFTKANVDTGETWWAADITAHVRLLGLDTCNSVAGPDGAVPQRQLDWLTRELARAQTENRLVVLLSHHNSLTLENRAQRLGDNEALYGAEELIDLLLRHPNAVAWLNGHTHVNQILPHRRGDRGFWEITTASCIDFPQQQQVVEIIDNRDGTLSLFTTVLDHASSPSPGTSGSVADLASRSRELAANDWIQAPAARRGSLLDRNTELLLRAPFDLSRITDESVERDRVLATARVVAWEDESERRRRGGTG